MNSWTEFARQSPEISAAGQRLFDEHVVALLGTVAKDANSASGAQGSLIAFQGPEA